MADEPKVVSAHGPYEDLGIKALEVAEKIIDGQTPEFRRQFYEWLVEDIKEWREVWKKLRGVGK